VFGFQVFAPHQHAIPTPGTTT